MTTAYIGLGSNLGDRKRLIDRALEMLARNGRIDLTRVSDVIETEPLGRADQPNYLNAVAEIETTLTAERLYERLADIETSLGRERSEKWAPRRIDLDLLLFGRQVINLPNLTVPHPQLHLRSFALSGLCRLNDKLFHPVIRESVGELAGRLAGSDFVLNPELPQLISVAGVIGVGKTTLAERLSGLLGCELLREPYDTNPFMPQVYAGRGDLALDSQLYFLAGRVVQLDRTVLAPGRVVVTDYVFDKELIYARRLPDSQQLSLYEDAYARTASKVAAPVLVIYLRDSAQSCLERIHRRNRSYEQGIAPQFLDGLIADYESLFDNWKDSPVIRLSMSEFDVTGDEDLARFADQVRCYVASQGPY